MSRSINTILILYLSIFGCKSNNQSEASLNQIQVKKHWIEKTSSSGTLFYVDTVSYKRIFSQLDSIDAQEVIVFKIGFLINKNEETVDLYTSYKKLIDNQFNNFLKVVMNKKELYPFYYLNESFGTGNEVFSYCAFKIPRDVDYELLIGDENLISGQHIIKVTQNTL
jgi:hypothetical protein